MVFTYVYVILQHRILNDEGLALTGENLICPGASATTWLKSDVFPHRTWDCIQVLFLFVCFYATWKDKKKKNQNSVTVNCVMWRRPNAQWTRLLSHVKLITGSTHGWRFVCKLGSIASGNNNGEVIVGGCQIDRWPVIVLRRLMQPLRAGG